MNCPKYIYIHWPFCKNKCHYCDFISFEEHFNFQKDYHLALSAQIDTFAQKFDMTEPIKTIFIGGGTPSLYPLELLEELFEKINKRFNLSYLQEVTIECNPADVDKNKLSTWKNLGINRLSVGVQLLNDKILFNMNRLQKISDVYNLFDLAPAYFENISVDLILGLPGTNEDIWFDTLSKVVSWPIKHLSVYLLTVYEKTPLFFKFQEKSKNIQQNSDCDKIDGDKKIINLFEKTVKLLADKNFEQYEISNFALPGFESQHNLAYWNRESYWGFGLSAASFDGKNRYVNQKNLIKFIDCCLNQDLAIANAESLNKEEEILERLMLGLRLKKGVDLHSMLYSLSDDDKNKFMCNLEELVQLGLINKDGGNIVLSFKGMMLENEVVIKLLSLD